MECTVNFNEKEEVMHIPGDFSQFSRVFCQSKNNKNFLILFSEKEQMFQILDLQTNEISEWNMDGKEEYQQVEFYDGKLFCVNRKTLTLDIYFVFENQHFLQRRTIGFANKTLKLKESFCLLVWKHLVEGTTYRCLLGPLEDGRYMNFDLPERWFVMKPKNGQIVTHISLVNLMSDTDNDYADIICMDEVEKSIICCSKKTETFFEYNGFSEKESARLFIIYIKKILYNKVQRMYCYYPYDFFLQKEKNRLKTKLRDSERDIGDKEAFIKSRYKEILLCIDGEGLYKIASYEEELLLKPDISWRCQQVCKCTSSLKDIAVNGRTGEIYCLCSQGIMVLENTGRKINEDSKKLKAVESLKYRNYNS